MVINKRMKKTPALESAIEKYAKLVHQVTGRPSDVNIQWKKGRFTINGATYRINKVKNHIERLKANVAKGLIVLREVESENPVKKDSTQSNQSKQVVDVKKKVSKPTTKSKSKKTDNTDKSVK